VALHVSDDVIFKVLIAVVLQTRAVLNVMPCRWSGRNVPDIVEEAAGSSEALVHFSQTKRRHIPKEIVTYHSLVEAPRNLPRLMTQLPNALHP